MENTQESRLIDPEVHSESNEKRNVLIIEDVYQTLNLIIGEKRDE